MSRLGNTTYFEEPGKRNTGETLRLAKERAEELGIKNIIVASSSGETGAEASRVFRGLNLVVVTSVTGYARPDEVRMRPESRGVIEANGGRVVMAAHALLDFKQPVKEDTSGSRRNQRNTLLHGITEFQ